MSPRRSPALVLLGMMVLAGGRTALAAQAPPQPQQPARPVETAITIGEAYIRRNLEINEAEKITRRADATALGLWWLKAREEDLREGRGVAVRTNRGPVFLTRAEFNRSLLEWAAVMVAEIVSRSGDLGELRRFADAELLKTIVRPLEQDALRESEAYRRELEATIRNAEAREAELREQAAEHWARAQALELRRAELERAGKSDAAGWPQMPADRRRNIDDLSSAKRAAGEWLDRVRKDGNWSPDHHYSAGLRIGLAVTREDLTAVTSLIKDYQGCYTTKNSEQAAVAANARAGQYPTPGDRIGKLNTIADAFNRCIARADDQYRIARGR